MPSWGLPPHDLIQIWLPPNTPTLRIRLQHMNFGGEGDIISPQQEMMVGLRSDERWNCLGEVWCGRKSWHNLRLKRKSPRLETREKGGTRPERTPKRRGGRTACYGRTCVFLSIHMLKSSHPVPQNVTVFGDRAFKEVIKVN